MKKLLWSLTLPSVCSTVTPSLDMPSRTLSSSPSRGDKRATSNAFVAPEAAIVCFRVGCCYTVSDCWTSVKPVSGFIWLSTLNSSQMGLEHYVSLLFENFKFTPGACCRFWSPRAAATN